MAPKKKPATSNDLPKKIGIEDPDVLLRDIFAGQALTGLCATRAQHKLETIHQMAPELAATAYVLADYMLQMKSFDLKELQTFLKRRAQPPPAPSTGG